MSTAVDLLAATPDIHGSLNQMIIRQYSSKHDEGMVEDGI